MKNNSQARSGVKKGRYVKNRLMIGDSRPNFMTRPEARSSSMKLSKAGADWGNFVMDQMPDNAKRFGMQDGTKLKRDIRAREPRATDIYGSRKKALKVSFKKDIYGNRIKTEPKSRSSSKEKTFPSLPSFYG